MCLAIYRPANASGRITTAELETAYENNSDGFGFMTPQDGRLRVWKSPDSKQFGRFADLIHEMQERSAPLAVHFRWTTHGANDERNTHPHIIRHGRVGMIHNGIIQHLTHGGKEQSDSALFAAKLAQMPGKFWRNGTLCGILEDYIGKGNKVVILTHTGESRILNGASGHWRNGMWWSNSSYQDSYYSSWIASPDYKFLGSASGAASEAASSPATSLFRPGSTELLEDEREDFNPGVVIDGGDVLCMECWRELSGQGIGKPICYLTNGHGTFDCAYCAEPVGSVDWTEEDAADEMERRLSA